MSCDIRQKERVTCLVVERHILQIYKVASVMNNFFSFPNSYNMCLTAIPSQPVPTASGSDDNSTIASASAHAEGRMSSGRGRKLSYARKGSKQMPWSPFDDARWAVGDLRLG